MPSKDFNMVASNNLEVLQSPILVLPDEQPVYNITIAGSGTLSVPTMKLFKGSSDISGTNLTGSLTIAGRVITTKTITGLVGGNDYIFYVYFQDGGIPTGRFCRLIVPKEGVY